MAFAPYFKWSASFLEICSLFQHVKNRRSYAEARSVTGRALVSKMCYLIEFMYLFCFV